MSLLLKQFLSALALLACAVAATDAEGMAFLAANADKEGVTVLGSGLQYKVLKSGADGAPSPLASTPCDCHYQGTLIDGTKFDSSYDRGEPTKFAPNQVRVALRERGRERETGVFIIPLSSPPPLLPLPLTPLPPSFSPSSLHPGHRRLDRGHAADEGRRQVGAVHPQRPCLR